ncbi:hypothetical protein TNCV_4039931 [Trichonephila clavipes]|nr:hypothetical protein TNCV_4039931 [Trichonephila clavipes]
MSIDKSGPQRVLKRLPQSNLMAIGDGPRYYEPWLNDEDERHQSYQSTFPNFHTTRERLSLTDLTSISPLYTASLQ